MDSSQRQKKFLEIKKAYDDFYQSLLRKGKLPLRSTSKGFWGYSDTQVIFDFFEEINLSKYKNFLDLGSGDGKIALIASLFTKSTGIESDKELHDKGLVMKKKLQLNPELINADYYNFDVKDFDFVFINPDSAFYHGLEAKLTKELEGILAVYNIIFLPRFLKQIKRHLMQGMGITLYQRK